MDIYDALCIHSAKIMLTVFESGPGIDYQLKSMWLNLFSCLP